MKREGMLHDARGKSSSLARQLIASQAPSKIVQGGWRIGGHARTNEEIVDAAEGKAQALRLIDYRWGVR